MATQDEEGEAAQQARLNLWQVEGEALYLSFHAKKSQRNTNLLAPKGFSLRSCRQRSSTPGSTSQRHFSTCSLAHRFIMSSSTPRRTTSHQDGGSERRSSLKGPIVLSRPDDQQQSSPRCNAHKKDDEDEENNQEEATEESCERGAKASRRLQPDAAESDRGVHQMLKQAGRNGELPLTTTRLRMENAALKQQVKLLQHQHETQVQTLLDKLVSVTAVHEHALGEVKMTLSCVEIQSNEARKELAACRFELQQLSERMQKMESFSFQGKSKDASAVPLPPRTPYVKPGLSVPPHRRGNGSPLPYNQPIRSAGPVKPFAWRDQVERAMIVHGTSDSSCSPQSPKSLNRSNQHIVETGAHGQNTLSTPCDPVPFSPRPAQSVSPHRAVMEKKASGSLLSFCSEFISSKLSASCESPVAAAPSPSMKVMPAWMAEEQMQQRVQQTPPLGAAASELCSHTAIVIPEGIPTSLLDSSQANEAAQPNSSLLATATSQIGDYLSQAVLPIHATSPS